MHSITVDEIAYYFSISVQSVQNLSHCHGQKAQKNLILIIISFKCQQAFLTSPAMGKIQKNI